MKLLVEPFDAATVDSPDICTSDRAYRVILPKKFSTLAREKK